MSQINPSYRSHLPNFPRLSREKLFERLNAAASGTIVVTPNRRLSQALIDDFNRYQSERQCAVWQSADVLPFVTFVERLYQDTLYACPEVDLPLLLSTAQSQLLWEAAIESHETGAILLNRTETARLAHQAWQTLHQWQLWEGFAGYPLNDDANAFREWAAIYRQQLTGRQMIDVACLSDLLRELVKQGKIHAPDYLVCYGFDHFSPQQFAFFGDLHAATGCHLTQTRPPTIAAAVTDNPADGYIKRVCYTDTQDEIYHAARWARARLEADPDAVIGVVVPGLTQQRSAVQRIFTSVMRPDVRQALPHPHQQQSPQLPFNISLGAPLSQYPLVDGALTILSLCASAVAYDRLSDLLRSSFLAGAETEIDARALLDVRLRRHAAPELTLQQLVSLFDLTQVTNSVEATHSADCPLLRTHFTVLLDFCQRDVPHKARYSDYARIFLEILQKTGFPGERTLDSNEYQTLKKLQSLIAELATLDSVNAQVSLAGAVGRLKTLAANTVFQPQTPRVPIQILGVLESSGLCFDHLWVMGLSEENWPLRAQPNPFIPYHLQQQCAMPAASVTQALAFSQRLTAGWAAGAREVVFSHPKFNDAAEAQETLPSALIRAIPDDRLEVPQYPRHRDLIMKAACFEKVVDDRVPPIARYESGGGVALIKDYAACPFQAWARHVLRLEAIEKPTVGLNAMERGILVHQVLAEVWYTLCDRQVLDDVDPDALEKLLAGAVDHAVFSVKRQRPYALSDRLMAVERRRLKRVVREWLEVEQNRADFSVVEIEQNHTIRVGALKLQGRIDRVDRLASGALVIIDYKTGRYNSEMMLGERPDEPQLPLYLVMADPQWSAAAGVAFALVKSGQMRFSAIMNEDGLLPGVVAFDKTKSCSEFPSWTALLDQWRRDFLRLGDDFLAGDVRVAPKDFPKTCQYCDFQSSCRIHERLTATESEAAADD